MANAYKNPMIVDTAAADLIVPGDVFVDLIRWVGATTAGHAVEIQDGAGNPFWASVANGANYVERDPVRRTCKGGLKVPTLGSGKLYLYLFHEPRNY